MKHLLTTLFTILILTMSAQSQSAANTNGPSLFERLGGTEGITKIVDDVIVTHMNNPAISARFAPYQDQPDRFALIRQHTIDFFSMGSGGPVAYNGRDMATTHAGMNISAEEFINAVDDIMIVLDKHQIDAASQKDVLAILWSLKGMIIGQ